MKNQEPTTKNQTIFKYQTSRTKRDGDGLNIGNGTLFGTWRLVLGTSKIFI